MLAAGSGIPRGIRRRDEIRVSVESSEQGKGAPDRVEKQVDHSQRDQDRTRQTEHHEHAGQTRWRHRVQRHHHQDGLGQELDTKADQERAGALNRHSSASIREASSTDPCQNVRGRQNQGEEGRRSNHGDQEPPAGRETRAGMLRDDEEQGGCRQNDTGRIEGRNSKSIEEWSPRTLGHRGRDDASDREHRGDQVEEKVCE